MSRLLLLVVIVLWMSRQMAPGISTPIHLSLSGGALLFLAGLALVVLFAALWSRVLARHTRGDNLYRSVQRFHNVMWFARLLIPVWFGIAVFLLEWGRFIDYLLSPLKYVPIELPGLILGTLPAFAAWMALWWAQFPADRALREQNMLVLVEENLPVHTPPSFWSFFIANLRLQLLFTIVPVGMILLIRDIASLMLWWFGGFDFRVAPQGTRDTTIELLVLFGSIALVVLFAPEILRRVLHTQRLENSPLRTRLEKLCERANLRYRDILLWRTNNVMGNAAVMGLVPRMRYILLSDVLIESMTDQQIEAVFAHEIGHVKHWHMGWYIVIVATIMLVLATLGQIANFAMQHWSQLKDFNNDTTNIVATFGSMVIFFFVFGCLSRRFERQADVYAARTMQRYSPMNLPTVPTTALGSYVGPQGADLFIAALYRVAVINNIPLEPQRPTGRGIFAPASRVMNMLSEKANNYFHGSIMSRINYLRSLSEDPQRTAHFDRSMLTIYAGILLVLAIAGGWALISAIA